jgi:hypothetical protein
MKRPLKMLFLALPVLLFALLALIIAAADAWLESASGRRAVETALTRSVGMPVRLAGNFSLDVIPPVGVSGTDLLIGETGGSALFASSREFRLVLEALPLLSRELIITSLHLAQGVVDPRHYREKAGDGSDTGRVNVPSIGSLVLEEFRILTASGSGSAIEIHSLRLDEFGGNGPAAFALDASFDAEGESVAQMNATGNLNLTGAERLSLDFETLTVGADPLFLTGDGGTIHWRTGERLIEARIKWREESLGELETQAIARLADQESGEPAGAVSGTITARLIRPQVSGGLDLDVEFSHNRENWVFPSLDLTLDSYRVSGRGCLLAAPAHSLQLQLRSESMDLDRLAEFFPSTGQGGDGATPDFGFLGGVELYISEARIGGAVAHGVRISTGQAPDCGWPEE